MDIEKLKRKRQLNVQEQNALARYNIYQEAMYWRSSGIPDPLRLVFEEKGINTAKSIFLNYEQNFPGISSDEGIVLTPDGVFYKFEVNLNKSRTEIIELYAFENVTSNIEVNEHKRGSGSTWGFLALQVLNELSEC